MPKISYKELLDKNWLEQKYVIERLSTVQIANLLGCRATTVMRALKRRGVKIRSINDAAVGRKKKGFKSKFLSDKNWLEKKYIEEKMDSYEIAELAETNQHSVMVALKFYNIQTRNLSESKILSNEKHPIESSFKIIKDKNWLYNQYIVNLKGTPIIAKEVGCSVTTILHFLNKYDIPIRSNSEAQLVTEKKSYKYDVLNDYQLLYDYYIVRKFSTNDIADLFNIPCANSVRQGLIRADIPVRDVHDGLEAKRTSDNIIFNIKNIDDLILCGAKFYGWNLSSENSYPYLSKVCLDNDYASYISNVLFSIDKEKRIFNYWTHDVIENKSYGFEVRTLSYKQLKEIYFRWNCDGVIKLPDIKFDNTTLLRAYLEYGYFDNNVSFNLSGGEFCKQIVEVLINYLNSISIRSKYIEFGEVGKFVTVFNVEKFFEIIGPCPCPSMEYKWKTKEKCQKISQTTI